MNNIIYYLKKLHKITLTKNILTSIILILLIYKPSKLQKSAETIYYEVYSKFITYRKFNHPHYKLSFNYMTSSDYKPYIDHDLPGNRLGYNFANEIIRKYYSKDTTAMPTLFFLPYNWGVETLLDGYRFNIQKDEFLIRNYNSLFKNDEITTPINAHGFFLDIENINIDSYLFINKEKEFIINQKNLVNCDKFKKEHNIFFGVSHNDHNSNIEKISNFKNCFYFELLNKNNLNFTVKLNKLDLITAININDILYYGNTLPIASYLVLERSPDNYDYLYAKVLKK